MIVLLAIAIVGTFVGGLLVLEANAWLPYSSSRLLGRTLARLPEGLDAATRARWSEEIEADLASYEDRPLGGLLFALRVRRRGARDLAAELALGERLAGSAPGSGILLNAIMEDGVLMPQVAILFGATPEERAGREHMLSALYGPGLDFRVVADHEEAQRLNEEFMAEIRRKVIADG
jgi:hypothetical protein